MKLGIIGPKDLVKKSINIGQRYEEIDMIPMPYIDEKNTMDNIRLIESQADAFLFTGFLPYYNVKHNRLTDKEIFYYPILGSALYRVLLKMKNSYGVDIGQISIDTLDKEEIHEIYEDLGISTKDIYVNDAHLSNYNRDDYVNFHYQLYSDKKTKGAITSINSVYERLVDLKVPVLKIEPTKYTMKDTFKMISIASKTHLAKNNQILIMIIDIDKYSLNGEKLSNIEMQEKRLQLHQTLLDYSRIYQASVFSSAESEEFIVLITKGMFQEYTNSYEDIPMVNEIKSKFSLSINIGIGTGINALEAEENARRALLLSKKSKESAGYLIDQDKVVLGPIGSKNRLEYKLKTENKDLLSWSEKTGLSISNITMIESLLNNMKTESITASDIQKGLNISLRSANRIMKKLVDGGAAVEVGLEQSGGRGRPSKLYRIKFH
ncbi:hypothetical protein [Wansuia hejianensis]|uniref:Transcriptional regulator n=1 Tax=Wansuia hejianensis TaxID=2763667 RepID=A0A926EXE4_9FIRM|nr:hypothetical protein [Wansuia hejianensis]MBC8590093.1 hypothetical protein [Wansuia hejianensis]